MKQFAKRFAISLLACSVFCLVVAVWAQAPAPGQGKGKQDAAPRIYNTAKQKLLEGKQLVGVTIFSPDPNIYCAAANSGYDFTWIEMQHSPLTYGDVAKMIYACRGASAMPFHPRARRDGKRYSEGHRHRRPRDHRSDRGHGGEGRSRGQMVPVSTARAPQPGQRTIRRAVGK